jgi:hypothetical protein
MAHGNATDAAVGAEVPPPLLWAPHEAHDAQRRRHLGHELFPRRGQEWAPNFSFEPHCMVGRPTI